MDRTKIVAAIIKKYRAETPHFQEHALLEALRRIPSDTSLLAFAIELGIDTDAVLAPSSAFEAIFPNGHKLPEIPGMKEANEVERLFKTKNEEVL